MYRNLLLGTLLAALATACEDDGESGSSSNVWSSDSSSMGGRLSLTGGTSTDGSPAGGRIGAGGTVAGSGGAAMGGVMTTGGAPESGGVSTTGGAPSTDGGNQRGGASSIQDAAADRASSGGGSMDAGALVLTGTFGPGAVARLTVGPLSLERASFGRATRCSGSTCVTGGFIR